MSEERQRINEAIAESIEPKPTNTPCSIFARISEGGFWVWSEEQKRPVSTYDFFTDETANALLLEALKSCASVVIEWSRELGEWTCEVWPTETTEGHRHSEAREMTTAVVLAYCKWKGIEVKL